MTLPFELDSLELLDACAVALLPLSPVPDEKRDKPFVCDEVLPVSEAHSPWFSAERAVLKRSNGTFGAESGAVSLEYLPQISAGISVEALSRAVERDARRFDANG